MSSRGTLPVPVTSRAFEVPTSDADSPSNIVHVEVDSLPHLLEEGKGEKW